MKRILTIMAAIVCLAACEKPVDTSKIIGTWSECYDDPNFVMDGTVEQTFKADGTYQVYAYDALSGNEVTRTHEYTLDGNVITLNTATTDSAHSPSYTITELDDNEMSWQKVGTTYTLVQTAVIINISRGNDEKDYIFSSDCNIFSYYFL